MESLSHDELVKIAKERGHESLSGIIKPRLTNLDNNWILQENIDIEHKQYVLM